MIKKIVVFFDKPFFKDKENIAILWIIASVIAIIPKFLRDKYNNYLIYKGVFYHILNKTELYTEYPTEYFDKNHYGPIFSFVIAPFAILPDWLGTVLWSLFLVLLIVWAIYNLPLKNIQIAAILWICFNEYLISAQSFQVNAIMVFIIVMSYVFITKKHDFWSAMLIALGTFIKLYGIVGLAFFFFSKQKPKFILSLLFWGALFFVLPMLISSPQYIIERYVEWFTELIDKNQTNAVLGSYQDFSVMGVIRRFANDSSIPNTPFLIVGLILFGLPYLRFKAYSNQKFQLLLLSSVLIFTVIFSSGSESPTYIIAFVGVAIWFVIQSPKTNFIIGLLIFALILTSFSHTDLFPRFLLENYVRKYSLKAVPCIIIWFVIVYQMLTEKFEPSENENNNMNSKLFDIINNFETSGSNFIIGNRNKIKTFDYQGITINVKSFRKPILINGFIYKYFRESKAKRSFENASILLNKGIGTPKPIAYYENFNGIFLRDSYYICEHLIPDLIFRDVFGNEEKYEMEKILRGLAKFTFKLHENGIEFLDHSPGNTLIKCNNDDYNFYLVDLNRMKFHTKMSFEMRMKNLSKIAPSEYFIRIISNEYAKLYKQPESKIFEHLWQQTQKFQSKYIRKQALKKKFLFWK